MNRDIVWNNMNFFAPYDSKHLVLCFKKGDYLLDCKENTIFKAVDKKGSVISLDSDREKRKLSISKLFSENKRYRKKYTLTYDTVHEFISLSEAFKANSRQTLPTSSGVYCIYDLYKTLLYVGRSENLRRRVKEHISGPTALYEFQHFPVYISFVLENSDEIRSALEFYLINEYYPLLNTQRIETYEPISLSELRVGDWETISTIPIMVGELRERIKSRERSKFTNNKSFHRVIDYLRGLDWIRSRKLAVILIDYLLDQCSEKETQEQNGIPYQDEILQLNQKLRETEQWTNELIKYLIKNNSLFGSNKKVLQKFISIKGLPKNIHLYEKSRGDY